MELKWTGKALSDLVRLYEFLTPVSKPAAAHAVQALTAAPTTLYKFKTFDPILTLFTQGI